MIPRLIKHLPIATAGVLWAVGLALLWSVNWKIALAVFLIGWALNIEQRLKRNRGQ